jgi:hypothetical protein
MRDAKNLQTLNLRIDNQICKINSVWITEEGSIFIKVEVDDYTVNYQAEKLISILKEQNLLNLNAKIPKLCSEDI